MRRLQARATARQLSLEDYLVQLVERDALSEEDWEALADEVANLVPMDAPPLSNEALRRDTMYRD